MIAPPWISIPPATYGGTESIIAFIVEELVAQGHDVTLFAPGDARTSAKLVSFFPHSLIADGVPWQAALKAYFHLAKSIERAGEFDIVHLHLSSTADMFQFPLLSQIAVPHVTTVHSNFPYDRVHDWIGDADQYFMEWIRPAPLVTVSERARKNLPPGLNVAGVVHLGVPMADYRFAETGSRDYVTWLGRFAPDKGAHTAIDAAKRAGVKILVAGIVEQGMQASIDYFKREVEPRLDGEQARYIGPVNLEQKLNLLGGARALLNPITWEEPGATVVVEAMAVGCPVIAFGRGVVPELILDGRTGFVVDDIDEMVACIGKIHEIDRRSTHEHVAENLSAFAMARKYVAIYERLRDAA
ncbi:MAG: glycosyltransferase family 4 protein [Rhodospirillales bacterium]|nr:glycosyltransferase family 4 protein [Rhodospirillales bacterium]